MARAAQLGQIRFMGKKSIEIRRLFGSLRPRIAQRQIGHIYRSRIEPCIRMTVDIRGWIRFQLDNRFCSGFYARSWVSGLAGTIHIVSLFSLP